MGLRLKRCPGGRWARNSVAAAFMVGDPTRRRQRAELRLGLAQSTFSLSSPLPPSSPSIAGQAFDVLFAVNRFASWATRFRNCSSSLDCSRSCRTLLFNVAKSCPRYRTTSVTLTLTTKSLVGHPSFWRDSIRQKLLCQPVDLRGYSVVVVLRG